MASSPTTGDDALKPGTTTYSSTVSDVDTPETVSFPDHYGYVTVTNCGPGTLFVNPAGTAAETAGVGAPDTYVVPEGDTRIFANGSGIWYQSVNAMLPGTDNANGQSKEALLANPGTKVSIIANWTTPDSDSNPVPGPSYTVEAAG